MPLGIEQQVAPKDWNNPSQRNLIKSLNLYRMKKEKVELIYVIELLRESILL